MNKESFIETFERDFRGAAKTAFENILGRNGDYLRSSTAISYDANGFFHVSSPGETEKNFVFDVEEYCDADDAVRRDNDGESEYYGYFVDGGFNVDEFSGYIVDYYNDQNPDGDDSIRNLAEQAFDDAEFNEFFGADESNDATILESDNGKSRDDFDFYEESLKKRGDRYYFVAFGGAKTCLSEKYSDGAIGAGRLCVLPTTRQAAAYYLATSGDVLDGDEKERIECAKREFGTEIVDEILKNPRLEDIKTVYDAIHWF